MTTTDDGDGRTGRTDGQRTTTTDDGDGRTGRRTDGGRRRTRRTKCIIGLIFDNRAEFYYYGKNTFSFYADF